MPPPPDRILNARLHCGTLATLHIQDGRFSAIETQTAFLQPEGDVLDAQGMLVLPTLFDGHIHLDKTLMGLPWIPHPAGPTRMSRIESDKKVLPHVPLSTAQRASNLIRRCVSHGSGNLRSHVDIDLESGLRNLEGVLQARDACRAFADVQVVAFPQSGVMRRPGTLALMDAAMAHGADLVGGIDPCEIDADPAGQLNGIFDIAERHGAGIDIHIHEQGELGFFSIREICKRSKALGMAGKVTVSHGYCLGQIAESKAQLCAELMAEAGVALVTHGAAAQPLPPLSVLRAHGVTVFAGNDDVRDTWSPYGNGDVLARAALVGWRADWRRDEQVEDAFDMVTASAARAFGIAFEGIAVGAPAHCFALEATTIPEAVGGHPPRRWVVRHGLAVAHNGQVFDVPQPLGRLARA